LLYELIFIITKYCNTFQDFFLKYHMDLHNFDAFKDHSYSVSLLDPHIILIFINYYYDHEFLDTFYADDFSKI